MGSLGMSEILVILVVVLILFGGKELPKIAKDLGKGWREFQKVTQNAREEIQKIINDTENNLKG